MELEGLKNELMKKHIDELVSTVKKLSRRIDDLFLILEKHGIDPVTGKNLKNGQEDIFWYPPFH